MCPKKSNHCNSVYSHKAQPLQPTTQWIIVNPVKWPNFCEHCKENTVRCRKSLTSYFLPESIIYCKYHQLNENRWVYSFSCIIPTPIVSSSTVVLNLSQNVTSSRIGACLFFFSVALVRYLQIWWTMKRDSEPLYCNRSVTQAQECLWWIGV